MTIAGGFVRAESLKQGLFIILVPNFSTTHKEWGGAKAGPTRQHYLLTSGVGFGSGPLSTWMISSGRGYSVNRPKKKDDFPSIFYQVDSKTCVVFNLRHTSWTSCHLAAEDRLPIRHKNKIEIKRFSQGGKWTHAEVHWLYWTSYRCKGVTRSFGISRRGPWHYHLLVFDKLVTLINMSDLQLAHLPSIKSVTKESVSSSSPPLADYNPPGPLPAPPAHILNSSSTNRAPSLHPHSFFILFPFFASTCLFQPRIISLLLDLSIEFFFLVSVAMIASCVTSVSVCQWLSDLSVGVSDAGIKPHCWFCRLLRVRMPDVFVFSYKVRRPMWAAWSVDLRFCTTPRPVPSAHSPSHWATGATCTCVRDLTTSTHCCHSCNDQTYPFT